MHNELLSTAGLTSIAFTGILLLGGCTTPAGPDTPDSSVIQTQQGIPLACSAPLLRPAKFTTGNERILVFEPAPEFENIPAVIDWGIKRIQVEPARFTHETVPAQYREETEKVLVLRERNELQGIPAVYKTIDRPVTIVPAHTRWKADCTDAENPLTCFEQVPAKTRVLQKQIIDIPNRIVQKRLPEQVMEVTKKILVKPGRGTGPVIPARYLDVKVGKVTRVWEIKSVYKSYTRPRYETVQVQTRSREEQIREFPVVCHDAAPVHIRKLQQQLQRKGFPARLSGRLDSQSLKALTQFQQANDLFVGAAGSETLEKLGLR